VREATAADIPTLATLVHTAFEDYRGRLDPPSGAHNETAETLRQALHTGWAALALVNNVAVGCVFYHQEDEHMYLGRLSVLRPFRRHGVGQALTEYVEQRARALGLPRVQLGVRIALPYLQAYYERLGYHVMRYESHAGYTVPTSVIMEKLVAPSSAGRGFNGG
jgi:ribosomal protein S18 acetylase RimI-like enzyme